MKAGHYRRTSTLYPKQNQQFVGEYGAVFNGSKLLTSFSREGQFWVAAGQSQQSTPDGRCDSGYLCQYKEDVFWNDWWLRRVGSTAELGPGKYYFDYANDKIYFYDDPTRHKVEAAVAPEAFRGTAATGVGVKNLVIEKFANAFQLQALPGGDHWTIENNDIRLNHGQGVGALTGGVIRANYIHHNGQMGVTGSGTGLLVENNEISYNSPQIVGADVAYYGGGSKFWESTSLVVRGNYSHHNRGAGLWTDINNLNTLYEDNRVESNTNYGIYHEISCDVTIRNNSLKDNGLQNAYRGTIWGAGISIINSPNAHIHGNALEGNAAGIVGVQWSSDQIDAHPLRCPRELNNLYVHDNQVRMPNGQTGIWVSYGDTSFFTTRGNRFQANAYYLPDLQGRYFAWNNSSLTKDQWRAAGQDTTGTFSSL